MSGATLGAVTPPPGYLRSDCGHLPPTRRAPDRRRSHDRHGPHGPQLRGRALAGCARTFWSRPRVVSSGYAPLGAVIASKKVVDAIANGSGAFLHGFTYNAHPVSVAAGRAVLRRMQSQNWFRLPIRIFEGTAGSALKERSRKLARSGGRGRCPRLGLLWGVEFVADKKTKAPFPPEKNFAGLVGQACLRRGLLVYPMQGCVDGVAGDHLLIAPPAVITPEQIGWAVEQLRAAVRETTA